MNNDQQLLGLNLRDYFNEIVQDGLEKFDTFIRWSEDDKKQFRYLLEELKRPFDRSVETTKEKGDRLENLVEFIIRKSYFFEIYKNVHTETNEIDEVILFSDRGKQALKVFDLSRDLIPIEEDLFLGECKNYESNLGVTYVGKFYSLLSVTKIPFGIVFTQTGLTGNSEGFKDAYGLIKILRLIESSKGNNFYIIAFTMDDYEKMLEGNTFFDLIKAKMLEIKLASDYTTFLKDYKHSAEEQIKDILENYHYV